MSIKKEPFIKLESAKRTKGNKLKLAVVLFLCAFILIEGIYLVDISMNRIMNNQDSSGIKNSFINKINPFSYIPVLFADSFSELGNSFLPLLESFRTLGIIFKDLLNDLIHNLVYLFQNIANCLRQVF